MSKEYSALVTMHENRSASAYGTSFITNGLTIVGMQITGTYSGSVLFQGTIDGTHWINVLTQDISDESVISASTTGSGIFWVNVAPLAQLRAWPSIDSGSISIYAVGSTAPRSPIGVW